MVNMKLEKKNTEEKDTVLAEQPEYPYGLVIQLEDSCLDKLGIKELPEIGKVMTLQTKVKVTGVFENSSEDFDKENKHHRHVSLQITDMELSDIKEEKSNAEVLYGAEEENQ